MIWFAMQWLDDRALICLKKFMKCTNSLTKIGGCTFLLLFAWICARMKAVLLINRFLLLFKWLSTAKSTTERINTAPVNQQLSQFNIGYLFIWILSLYSINYSRKFVLKIVLSRRFLPRKHQVTHGYNSIDKEMANEPLQRITSSRADL